MTSPDTATATAPDPLAPVDPGPAASGLLLAQPSGPAATDGAAVPYHRLDAPLPRRWWRLAVPLVVFVMVQVEASLAVALGSLLPERGVPLLGRHTQLAVLFAGIAACLPLLAAYMRRKGRPFGQISSVAGRLRRNWLATCVTVTVTPFLAMAVAFIVLQPQDWTGWAKFLPAIAVLLVLVVFQAATEEYLCRGLVLQTIGGLFATPWPAILVQAVLFTALHAVGTVPGMIDVFGYAVMLGWLTVRTGGLEAAIALHVAQNSLGVVVDVATLPAAVTQAATDKTIADASWLAPAVHLTLIAVFVIFLDRIAVWGNIARRTIGHTTGQAAA